MKKIPGLIGYIVVDGKRILARRVDRSRRLIWVTYTRPDSGRQITESRLPSELDFKTRISEQLRSLRR